MRQFSSMALGEDRKMAMNAIRSWLAYPATYRAKEVKLLAGWIMGGESGSVVGLPGSGRTNLLSFLCYRPEVIQNYLPPQARSVVLVPVDLNNLPATSLSSLYRVIIRAFYRVRYQFSPTLQQEITDIYQESRVRQDAFLAQSSLQDLLLLFQAQQIRVVLVLNRFDHFCQRATPAMVNTLRGLRDDFKDVLSYITGMTQEVAYLPDRSILGEMYELLDSYICWVGAMAPEDARNLIARATRPATQPPTEAEVRTMLALSGGYPALLRATCYWWLTTEDKLDQEVWLEALLLERNIQHRLAQMWRGLTQEEQFTLSELQRLQTSSGQPKNSERKHQSFVREHQPIISRLAIKGLCCKTEVGWQISAELLMAYVANVEGRGRGKIWLDEKTGEIYQGHTLVKDLTSLEKSVLSFLIKSPRLSHTKTDLIVNTWPDELSQQGVTDNSLYQVILAIRKTIEPNLSEPVYLLTWRGKPEGGYQFFPEGRPQ
jgi:hypothetical protein